MTNPSTSHVATPTALPVRTSPRGAQNDAVVSDALRFSDVLAESKPGIQSESGRWSAEQMFEPQIQNASERHKSSLRQDYREVVDRQSAARNESRTGVKARRASTTQDESNFDAVAPQSLDATRTTAKVAQDSIVPKAVLQEAFAEPAAPAPMKMDSSQKPLAPEEQVDGRAATFEHEVKTRHPVTANMPARPVDAGSTPGAPNPQAARELARLLASPPGSERGPAPVQTVANSGSVNAGNPDVKVAKNAVRADGSSRASNVSSKSPTATTASEFEKLIRLMRASAGQSSTRVMLDPPDLGKVHVRIKVEGDRVEVGVETENEAARQLISDRAIKLKTALEQHGLVIDRFDVTTNQSGLFDLPFVQQEALRPRNDHDRQKSGRGLTSRSRATTNGVPAIAELRSVGAQVRGDMRVDIQV